MNIQQAIEQLQSLKRHCQSMESSDFDIWGQDVEALDFAINIIKQMEESEPFEMTSFNSSADVDIDFIKIPVPLLQTVYRIEKNPMFNAGVESAEIFLYGKVITPKYIINKVPFQISMLDEYGKMVFKDGSKANEKMKEMLRG